MLKLIIYHNTLVLTKLYFMTPKAYILKIHRKPETCVGPYKPLVNCKNHDFSILLILPYLSILYMNRQKNY